LAGFVERLRLDKPNVAGLSFGGALALEFYRRRSGIPMTLILASAYAGWGGSLPADVAEERLRQALVLADLPRDEFVGALLPTKFSERMTPEAVDAFGASMLAFHLAGFRAMARASAEDLRSVPPYINVPTLFVYGDKDVRAPQAVAKELQAAISGSTVVVVPGVGHLFAICATSKPLRSSTRRSGPSCAAPEADRFCPRTPTRNIVHEPALWGSRCSCRYGRSARACRATSVRRSPSVERARCIGFQGRTFGDASYGTLRRRARCQNSVTLRTC
jgi:surfactin synthase thioesterase subunit